MRTVGIVATRHEVVRMGRWRIGLAGPKTWGGFGWLLRLGGEEQPQIPRSAYPAKSGRGPRRAALRDDTLLWGSGSGGVDLRAGEAGAKACGVRESLWCGLGWFPGSPNARDPGHPQAG